MTRTLVTDLADQHRRAIGMVRQELALFDARTWVQGTSDLLTPVCVAMHIVDTLDYYYTGVAPRAYRWGHRFGGGWWELAPEDRPTVDQVVTYLDEIEARILAELAGLEDVDLARPFELDGSAQTYLGHYVYALRHTMHHHGELAALAIHHGLPGGSWA